MVWPIRARLARHPRSPPIRGIGRPQPPGQRPAELCRRHAGRPAGRTCRRDPPCSRQQIDVEIVGEPRLLLALAALRHLGIDTLTDALVIGDRLVTDGRLAAAIAAAVLPVVDTSPATGATDQYRFSAITRALRSRCSTDLVGSTSAVRRGDPRLPRALSPNGISLHKGRAEALILALSQSGLLATA